MTHEEKAREILSSILKKLANDLNENPKNKVTDFSEYHSIISEALTRSYREGYDVGIRALDAQVAYQTGIKDGYRKGIEDASKVAKSLDVLEVMADWESSDGIALHIQKEIADKIRELSK